MFGIVAPRSLRAFEADSRQPDKEPIVFRVPQRGFKRHGKSVVYGAAVVLAGGFSFGFEKAGEAGGRLVEDPNKLAGRREEQTKQLRL